MDVAIDDVSGRDRRRGRGLDHLAMLWNGDRPSEALLSSFLSEASGRGDPVALIARRKRSGVLDSALSETRGNGYTAAEMLIAEQLFPTQNAATVVLALRRLLDEYFTNGAQGVTLVMEPFVGSSVDEQSEWARCEAVMSRAFATTPLTILCVYDERTLPASVLSASLAEQIARTHPCFLTSDGLRDSETFLQPDQVFSDLTSQHLPIERSAPALDVAIERSGGIPRQAVRRAVAAARLPAERVRDLVVAFNEIATNAVVHGDGCARVRVWAEEDVAVCTVSDEGTAFRDPLAGYDPPVASQMTNGGMGLWLSRQLCDEVDIVPGPSGLDVRLVVRA